MTEADTPYTITGPAMMNILAPKPVIKPSVLNSIAGELIAFAKPVIGTSVPAPACLAILSYTPSIVSSTPKKISDTETKVFASVSSNPHSLKSSNIPCPSAQIPPPMTKAFEQFT